MDDRATVHLDGAAADFGLVSRAIVQASVNGSNGSHTTNESAPVTGAPCPAHCFRTRSRSGVCAADCTPVLPRSPLTTDPITRRPFARLGVLPGIGDAVRSRWLTPRRAGGEAEPEEGQLACRSGPPCRFAMVQGGVRARDGKSVRPRRAGRATAVFSGHRPRLQGNVRRGGRGPPRARIDTAGAREDPGSTPAEPAPLVDGSVDQPETRSPGVDLLVR